MEICFFLNKPKIIKIYLYVSKYFLDFLKFLFDFFTYSLLDQNSGIYFDYNKLA